MLVPPRAAGGFLAIALAVLAACSSGGGDAGPSPSGPSRPSTPTPVLTTVTITPPGGSSGALVAGQTLQLTAVARDQSGNSIAATITWSTSTPAVATVSAAGLVTAVAAGSATITATAAAGSGSVVANFTVTVSAPSPVLTSVTVTGGGTITVGQTLQLAAAPRDQAGNTIAAGVSWTTSAASVATVSASGLVTGIAVGAAIITATATSGSVIVSGTANVAVQAATPVLSGVSITPATATLQAGSTLQLTAVPVDQNGSAISATITWSSSAAGVATVSAAGLVTGVAAGSAVITAQASAGGVVVSATRNLTVTAVPPMLTSVDVSGPASSLVVGATLQLTATARDQFGSAIAATYSWSSSNTSRATVSASGLVTGVAGGAVTITAEATSGGTTVAGAAALTVQALASVQVTAPATTVAVGQTLQLSASPRDQNNNPIAGATVAWSSNATGVATVNAGTGLVTGVAAGNANITAQATLGSAVVSSFLAIQVTAPPPASVTTAGLSFDPFNVTITAGGSVEWTGLLGHNVTFTTPGSPSDISGPSSGTRTFTAAGVYSYYCTFHGTPSTGMRGTVTVN